MGRSLVSEELVREWFPAGSVTGLGDGDYRIEFLAHGLTQDGRRYYPKSVLESAAQEGLFDGVKMYLGHGDAAADARRGHRDLRDWVATVKAGTVVCVDGRLQAVCHAHTSEARSILDDPVARRAVGLSHNSLLRQRVRSHNGADVQSVERIVRAESVDFVPSGNAWGKVLESMSLEGAEEMEAEVREAVAVAVREGLEAGLGPVLELLSARLPVVAPAVEAVEGSSGAAEQIRVLEAEVAAMRRERIVEETHRIVESEAARVEGLSPTVRARVVESLRGVDMAPTEIAARVGEAVERENSYARSLLLEAGGAARVRGLGSSGPVREGAAAAALSATEQALRESGATEDEVRAYMSVG